MGACGSSEKISAVATPERVVATKPPLASDEPFAIESLSGEKKSLLNEPATTNTSTPDGPYVSQPPKRVPDDGRRGSKTGGTRRHSRRNSARRRSSAGSEGVSSWFHWDIFGGKVVDDDVGVPVSEELGLYFEWAETRVKCYDTHARRVAMKSHRLWKNEYKVRSDPRMTFRVRRFEGVTGELLCGWHIVDGSARAGEELCSSRGILMMTARANSTLIEVKFNRDKVSDLVRTFNESNSTRAITRSVLRQMRDQKECVPGRTLEFTIVLDPLVPGDGVDLDAQHAAYCAMPIPARYGPALPTIDVTMVLAEDYYGHLQRRTSTFRNMMPQMNRKIADEFYAEGATNIQGRRNSSASPLDAAKYTKAHDISPDQVPREGGGQEETDPAVP